MLCYKEPFSFLAQVRENLWKLFTVSSASGYLGYFENLKSVAKLSKFLLKYINIIKLKI